MNSSGIKRGLATTAVTALAVAGLPLIASSASAATGDSMTLVSVSPARNGGDAGVLIQVTVKGINENNVKIADSNLADFDPNTPNQTIGSLSVHQVIADKAAGDSNPNDGLDEVVFKVSKITTSADGGDFKFALFEDEANPTDVDADEARVQVTGKTAGAVKAVTVSPGSQSAPLDTDSGKYKVSLVDANGQPTQLSGAEQVGIALANGFSGATVSDGTITKDEALKGFAEVTAKGSTLGLKTFEVTPPAGATGDTFNLDVLKAAKNIGTTEIDVQAGVDDFNGFGDVENGAATYNFANDVAVRIDQTSVTIAVRDTSTTDPKENANATLQLKADSVGTVRFGGKTTTTQSTVLDSSGAGAITFTPDAGTIKESSGINITTPDGNVIKIRFVRPTFDSAKTDATSYVSAIGGSVDVTVTAKDQFGLPISGAYLAVQRLNGVNKDANPSAMKRTDENGKATFTLTDTKATAVSKAPDDVKVLRYADQYDTTPADLGNQAKIYYTADGQGSEFAITVDNVTPAGAAYDPASVFANPLTDGTADDTVVPADGKLSGNEHIVLDTSGGTPGLPVTVSADNGALILKATDTKTLAQAKAEQTGVIGDDFWIVGTKTGLVNVTVTSGGKSKTAQVTIKKLADNSGTARNVSVSGPAEAVSGDTVAFPVKVTDAFGNPVAGFKREDLNVTVSGPGRFQDGDAVSNADGILNLNVRLDDNAGSAVTVNVTVPGTKAQFGAAANRIQSDDTTNTGPGLPASVTSASATIADVTNIEELEEAVEEAEAALAAAEADLAEAQADLDVAQTELSIALSEVDRLQERKAELRKKLNKAKKADNKQKAKTTRKKLRKAKSDLRDAKEAATIAQAAVEAEQVVVEERKQAVTEAEEALEQAKQDLEDAQS